MTQTMEPQSAAAQANLPRVSHWINGKIVASTSGQSRPVYNPATGQQTKTVDVASPEEIELAVAAAKEAFPMWRATSLSKRADTLFRIRNAFDSHRDEIGALITAEHGKVLSDAAGELARGIENIEYACGVPQLQKGEFSEQVSTGVDVYSIRQPLGVVAGITPFNFPAMVPMWMFGNAIATGNTFILKPSTVDPSVSIYLAQLMQEAGLPDGVFNVLQGDRVAVSRPDRAPRHRSRLLRRLDAGGEAHLRDRHQAPASACRPSVAPRTT